MRYFILLTFLMVCDHAFTATLPGEEADTLVVTFRPGWNYFSSCLLPQNQDMKAIFAPLMESGHLEKIRDETGLSMENLGLLGGWINFIGKLDPAKGYQVRVKSNCTITLVGRPALFPVKIPLRKGWNLIGYPAGKSREGMMVVRQLIDRGTLVRMEDESGNSIAFDGSSWKNGIGSLSPGKGYMLKVSANDILTITGLPVVQTLQLADISMTAANCLVNLSSDGGDAILERGICWNTSGNPLITDSKTAIGLGTGTFTAGLAGLVPNTVYYVRAFASNSLGTAYGETLSFATFPLVSTSPVYRIMATSVSGGGYIAPGGKAAITARGLCWNTSGNPVITGDKIAEGNGTGSFFTRLPGLTPLTTYYVRAWATNISGTAYGEQIIFTTNPTAVDIDGNVYNTVKIGSKIWMAENLKTTRYRDKSAIPLVTGDASWSAMTSGAMCWYNNDTIKKTDTGGLYNWYAAVSSRNLCPAGWHIPDEEEWIQLVDLHGGELVAGGKLKETGTTLWNKPNTGATNETGFSAIGGGIRGGYGAFYNLGNMGYYWSSTPFSATLSVNLGLYYDDEGAGVSYLPKEFGVSVRCVKD